MTDKHYDAAVQRLVAKVARIQSNHDEAIALAAALPDDGMVPVRVLRNVLEAVDPICPRKETQ